MMIILFNVSCLYTRFSGEYIALLVEKEREKRKEKRERERKKKKYVRLNVLNVVYRSTDLLFLIEIQRERFSVSVGKRIDQSIEQSD